MKIEEYLKRRLTYQNKVEQRDQERMSLSAGVDDTPYYLRVIEEMMIDLIERVEKVEKLFDPAPADKPEKKIKYT